MTIKIVSHPGDSISSSIQRKATQFAVVADVNIENHTENADFRGLSDEKNATQRIFSTIGLDRNSVCKYYGVNNLWGTL